MKEAGIFIAALVLFLIALVIVLSLLARTWALFSLQAEEYWLTGSCKNEIHLLSKSGESIVKKEGFLYFNYNASSLADIPMRKVLMLDQKGVVKLAVDDLKLIPNLTMVLVAVVFIASGFYLTALLMGIMGDTFYENLQLILHDKHWVWIRYLSVSIVVLLVASLSINMYFAVTLQSGQGDSGGMLGQASIRAGDKVTGEVIDQYTEEVFMERFNKIKHQSRICVKITDLYNFPIILDLAVNESAAAKDAIDVGKMINMEVSKDLIVVWKGVN